MSERILRMPRLGETMEEGRITGWLVKPGESFRRGDAILEIETDKTVAEYPALGNGRLTDILAEAGEMIDVGAPIARIDIGDEPDWTGDEEDPAMPAETDLLMPRLGETMEEGRIARWLKVEGDTFKRGEAIIEIETDKTVAEFPALNDGSLVGILRQEGEMVPFGEPIARITAPVETGAARPADAEPAQDQTIAITPTATTGAAVATQSRVRATPLARRLAHSHRLDIAAIPGSGRRGRVEKADVLAAAKGEGMNAPFPVVGGDVHFVSLERGRMAFVENQGAENQGNGEPILLLHGFAGDRTAWAAMQSGLRRAGRRVIAPDLPGHGMTEIEAAGVEDLGVDLAEFLDRLGVERVSVVAHSLGAMAGLALATTARARVSTVTLIAPAGLGSEIDAEFINGIAWASSAGEVSHLLRRLSVQPVELSAAALAQMTRELARGRLKALAEAVVGRSGQRVDTLGMIGSLAGSLPVTVLFGLEDKIIPWRQVTALPPLVSIHLLSRSGHMPQWDQVRDVVEIVARQGGAHG